MESYKIWKKYKEINKYKTDSSKNSIIHLPRREVNKFTT